MEISTLAQDRRRFIKSQSQRRKAVHNQELKPRIVASACTEASTHAPAGACPARLTIWRKSLLFNGNGYTVYNDLDGRLVFRVDNYACDWREETFLMDCAGNVLFTIRRCRKKLSISGSWEAFRGDREVLGCGADHEKPLIKATKMLGNPSCKLTVAARDEYRMKWSGHDGWSKIYRTTAGTSPVAEVSRKSGAASESFLGKDVLTLTVQPGIDQAMIMAMVMINDAMR